MMKKIYLGAWALIAGLNLTAQTIDFESTTLATNSFNNGSDLSGGFTYDGIHFGNYYDTNYFFNIGFAISNVTDNTTPGWGNQYSATTASGYNSANYAIFYPSEKIDLTSNPRVVQSIRITNTTYAALSMKNGDAVGKKFGSIYGANGNIDGTNGEDFLKLIIHSISFSGDTLGSLDYYLADYRFADSTQDYIVEDWELLDLSSLNVNGTNISFLVFDFESSDVGQFGINTPTYFAMDDFKYVAGTAEVSENKSITNWQVYPNPLENQLNIKGISGGVQILNSEGKVLLSEESSQNAIDVKYLSSGIYFVKIKTDKGIYTQRIVKL